MQNSSAKNKNSRHSIIFDFDGVIIDSLNVMIGLTRRLDSPNISLEEYRDIFLGNIFEIGTAKKFNTFGSAESKKAYYKEYRDGVRGLPIVPEMSDCAAITTHEPDIRSAAFRPLQLQWTQSLRTLKRRKRRAPVHGPDSPPESQVLATHELRWGETLSSPDILQRSKLVRAPQSVAPP